MESIVPPFSSRYCRTAMVRCSSCGNNKTSLNFSGRQLRNMADHRDCKECVSGRMAAFRPAVGKDAKPNATTVPSSSIEAVGTRGDAPASSSACPVASRGDQSAQTRVTDDSRCATLEASDPAAEEETLPEPGSLAHVSCDGQLLADRARAFVAELREVDLAPEAQVTSDDSDERMFKSHKQIEEWSARHTCMCDDPPIVPNLCALRWEVVLWVGRWKVALPFTARLAAACSGCREGGVDSAATVRATYLQGD